MKPEAEYEEWADRAGRTVQDELVPEHRRPEPANAAAVPGRSQNHRSRMKRTGIRRKRREGRKRLDRRKRSRRPLHRPSRRRVLLRRWVAAAISLVVLAGVALLLFTPALGVRSIRVGGTHLLAADQVRAAAGVANGTSMVWLSTDAVRTRVSALPPVASVEVSRSWPSTLDIEITERTPVALFAAFDGTRLVDRYGVPYGKADGAVSGLPVIELPRVAADDPATNAVVAVLGVLPDSLRRYVTTLTATSTGNVRFTFVSGRRVKWGTAADSSRKAAVLRVLLSQPGDFYDVSSPDLPGVS